MKKHLKKLVLLMILGMGIVSSSTLSTFNKGFYNSQEVVVDKKLLKLTKGNDVENLSSMSYIDNYIPQEKEEVEIEEENLIDENVSIFEFNYNIALWSDDESLIKKSSITLEYYNNGWKTKRIFNPKEMSTNKDNLTNYVDVFESGATKIRFIIRTNYVNNTNNRGCMVVGNINYKYGI